MIVIGVGLYRCDQLGRGDQVAVQREQRRVLRQEFLEARLRAAGDLSHFLGEPLGAELTTEVVQGPRRALVDQFLVEEQQGQVSH